MDIEGLLAKVNFRLIVFTVAGTLLYDFSDFSTAINMLGWIGLAILVVAFYILGGSLGVGRKNEKDEKSQAGKKPGRRN